MRVARLISLIALAGLAGCDLPSPAGPTAQELAAEEAAREAGADPVEAAEAGDDAVRAASPFAALFRKRETPAPAAAGEAEEAAVDPGEADEAAPKGLAALFRRKPETAEEAAPEGPPRALAVVGGRVTLAGPKGYCIDEDSVSDGRRAAFAILASCHILSEGTVGDYVPPAIMTVSVGPPGSGRDVPSASEIAATVGSRMVGGKDLGTFTMALLDSGGDALLETGDQRHWRAAFGYSNRLIGLALYAPKGSTLLYSDAGADLLSALRVSIENASR